MSSLAWIADGIDRAERAGGLTLERYHRPGFTGGRAVRQATTGGHASGFEIEADPEPDGVGYHHRAGTVTPPGGSARGVYGSQGVGGRAPAREEP